MEEIKYESSIGNIVIQIKNTESGSFSVSYGEDSLNLNNITKNLKLNLHSNGEELRECLDLTVFELLKKIGVKEKYNGEDINEIRKYLIPLFMTIYNSKFEIELGELDDNKKEDSIESNNKLSFKIRSIKKEDGINKGNKILLLLQGVPGSGKSTWIRENNLQENVLSTDDYRLRYGEIELRIDGKEEISQKSNKLVFQKLFEDIETRMQKSLFTIIDATHNNIKSINQYKELIERYGYSLMIKKFDISLEEAKRRNKERGFREVSDDVIERMYNNIQELGNIEGVTYINNREDLPNFISLSKIKNKYDKIFYIGDIQGCSREIKKFIEKYYNEKSLYIFVGDLLDRGYDDLGVLQEIVKIIENDNVIIIKGNHDQHLEKFYLNRKVKVGSRVFDEITSERVRGFSNEDLGKIVNKFVFSTYHEIGGKRIFACHGGVSKIPSNNISNEQLIRGIGSYDEHQICDENFEKWSLSQKDSFYYSVHGHRNSLNVHTKSTSRTFNLEGKIEFGGELRVISFDQKGKIEILNIESTSKSLEGKDSSLLERFGSNRFINIKDLGDGIHSVNFSREAFFGKVWDQQTIKARGLFIGEKNEIFARSYEKFFNVGEREETKKENIGTTLGFPIDVYHKYNGFLGIIGMKDGEIKYFSKSTNKGKFADLVRKHCSKYEDKLKFFLKEGYSAVFEICDDTDVHIVKEKERSILLDIIKNDIEFSKKSFKELSLIGKVIGCEVKRSITTINNEEELKKFLKDIEDHKIEGYILEGPNGMTKTKSKHYLFWKEIRGSIHLIKKYLNKEYGIDKSINISEGEGTYRKDSKEYIDKLNEYFLNKMNILDLKDEIKHYEVIKKFYEERIGLFGKEIPELIELSRDFGIKENPMILNDSE